MADYYVRPRPQSREWEVVSLEAVEGGFATREEALACARTRCAEAGDRLFVWDAERGWVGDAHG
jgi:hypothetical protein